MSTTLALVRVLDEASFDRCQRLFEEYVEWVMERLSDDYGISGIDPRPHHEVFRAELPALVGARGRLYVAEVGGEAVGTGALKPVSDTVGEVKRMYVHPSARRQGVARSLLRQLIADAKAIGYKRLRLESGAFMTASHALYRSVGFVDRAPFDGNEAAMSGLSDVVIFMEAPVR